MQFFVPVNTLKIIKLCWLPKFEKAPFNFDLVRKLQSTALWTAHFNILFPKIKNLILSLSCSVFSYVKLIRTYVSNDVKHGFQMIESHILKWLVAIGYIQHLIFIFLWVSSCSNIQSIFSIMLKNRKFDLFLCWLIQEIKEKHVIWWHWICPIGCLGGSDRLSETDYLHTLDLSGHEYRLWNTIVNGFFFCWHQSIHWII